MTTCGPVRRLESTLDLRRFATAAAIRQVLDGAKTPCSQAAGQTDCRPQEDGKGHLIDVLA